MRAVRLVIKVTVEILELLASVMPELGRQFHSLPNNAKYTSIWYKMIY